MMSFKRFYYVNLFVFTLSMVSGLYFLKQTNVIFFNILEIIFVFFLFKKIMKFSGKNISYYFSEMIIIILHLANLFIKIFFRNYEDFYTAMIVPSSQICVFFLTVFGALIHLSRGISYIVDNLLPIGFLMILQTYMTYCFVKSFYIFEKKDKYYFSLNDVKYIHSSFILIFLQLYVSAFF